MCDRPRVTKSPWEGWAELGDANIPMERAAERLLRGTPSRSARYVPKEWELVRYEVGSAESGKYGILVSRQADGSWVGRLQ